MTAQEREHVEAALARRRCDLRGHLDERLRRLWLAAEARSLGYGDNTIAATTIKTGLIVTAELDTASYPTGLRITDRQTKSLENTQLRRHDFHGDWNYTIHPSNTSGDQH